MRDVEPDPETESEYECLGCGKIVLAMTYPGPCPDCETAVRNRGMPME